MGRAPCCDKTKVKRGPWSPEEDNTLKNYVENHGTGGNWIALPQKAGLKRCGKSCRLRWLNYLRPNIKHGGFTEEEDNIILTLYHNIGSRWSVIASQLPERTDNDVKNYWNTKLKKKLLLAAATTTTTAASSSSAANNNFTNSTNSFNFGVDTIIHRRNSRFSVDIRPDHHDQNIVPYFPAVVSSNPEQAFPLPGLMEVPENNAYYHDGLLFPYRAPLMSSEEALSSTQMSPSVDYNVHGSGSVSWSTSTNPSGEDDDPFLAEHRYLLTNAFDFQDKLSDYDHQIINDHDPNFSYSDDLEPNISNTDQYQKLQKSYVLID